MADKLIMATEGARAYFRCIPWYWTGPENIVAEFDVESGKLVKLCGVFTDRKGKKRNVTMTYKGAYWRHMIDNHRGSLEIGVG